MILLETALPGGLEFCVRGHRLLDSGFRQHT